MLSFLSHLRELNATVQDINDTYIELTETKEERDARLASVHPLRWGISGMILLGFVILMMLSIASFDTEIERHQQEVAEAKAEPACSKNPWAIGCP